MAVLGYVANWFFGAPPHYVGLQKYTKKWVNLRQNSQYRPKFRVLYAKKYTVMKKYTTASSGGSD